MSLSLGQPSAKLVEVLRITLENIDNSPDISDEDVAWLQQLLVRLITELEMVKSDSESPLLATSEEDESKTCPTVRNVLWSPSLIGRRGDRG